MRMIKGMLSVAAAACFTFGTASADWTSYNVASDAAQMAPAGGGDAESLTSLRKKGAVKIGGSIELDIKAIRRDERDNNSDTFNKTDFKTSDADLDIRVDMTADAYLFLKLDLDDFQDGNAGNGDDLLEECKFVWKNVRGSDFTVILGKGEAPFGMDVDYLITDPYTSNSGSASYLAQNFNNGGGTGNAHAATGESSASAASTAIDGRGLARPGEIDNVFMIGAEYKWKELAKLELAVFQNNETNWNGNNRDGMHEDNSEDSLLFRSIATRLTVTPLEGLMLQVSFANQHLDSAEDNDTYGYAGGDEDAYSLSLGGSYKMRSVPLEFYGEYIHGWNVRHMDELSTDTLQVGLVWGVTEKIDVITDFEWLDTNDSVAANDIDEDFYRWSVGACYKTDYGVRFLVEYLHEWHDSDAGWDDTDADVFSFRTAYSF